MWHRQAEVLRSSEMMKQSCFVFWCFVIFVEQSLASNHFPSHLITHLGSISNNYQIVEAENFSTWVLERTSSPNYLEVDLNGDRFNDYIVVVKGDRGPPKLLGLINDGSDGFTHFFLNNLWRVEGKLEIAISLYKKSLASGLDGSGSLNDWKEVKLYNPGILVRSHSGPDSVIYWMDNQFYILMEWD